MPPRRWSIWSGGTLSKKRARIFESRYFLTFVWLPPAEDASRLEGWLYEGRSQTGVDPWELLRGFVDRTDRVLQLVEGLHARGRLARRRRKR